MRRFSRWFLSFCLFLSGPILWAQGTIGYSHNSAGDLTQRFATGTGERNAKTKKLSDTLHTSAPSLGKSGSISGTNKSSEHSVAERDTIFARQAAAPGPTRIVIGNDGKWYYTPNHYNTYIRFKP